MEVLPLFYPYRTMFWVPSFRHFTVLTLSNRLVF
jgi:hypothetical protein